MTDRFDLEQNIMQCWNVCDDIQLMLDHWDKLDEDQKQNYLKRTVKKNLLRLKAKNSYLSPYIF